MPFRDLQKVLHRYCNAVASACFSRGHSSGVGGYWYRRNSGAKSGLSEESRGGEWCAGPSSRALRDIRQGRHLRRWNSGGERWFPRITESPRSGRARDDCVGGERRGREVRRQCGWYLCEAFLG